MMSGHSLSVGDEDDLAAALESQLSQSRTESESDEIRLRLARLYLDALGDPDRAAVHAEELLHRDEIGAEAFELTTALLDHAPVAPRMAELLSTAYARLGRADSEAAALAVEMNVARPPRSDRVRRRLAELRYRELGDPASAHEIIEPLVTKGAADDDLRQLYIEIAGALGTQMAAAETLERALNDTMPNDVRERIAFDIATLYLQEGELKQARSAFLEVLSVDSRGPRALAAARRLLDLEGEPGDPRVMGAALETIAKAAPDAADRHGAAARLLSLHESDSLEESRLAIASQALVDSPRADEALEWLRGYHEKRGDTSALSGVYRLQALRAGHSAEARALAVLSIELCPDLDDSERIERWLWFIETFGPDRRANSEIEALFERAKRWGDLCRVIEARVDHAMPEEQPALWAQLGRVRLEAIGDVEGALAAFEHCLSLDPSNELALAEVGRLMASGDRRLAAADVLESVYRKTGSYAGQLRVLETRAELLTNPTSRLAAFAAAVDVAAGRLGDTQRALQLCRQALSQDPASPELLRRLDDLLAATESPDERLARYEAAIELTTAPGRWSSLMHAAAAVRRDSLDDLPGAIDVWRAILARDPSDFGAYDALVDASAKIGDVDGALDWMEVARESLQGRARQQMTLRQVQAMAQGGATDRALELCRQLLEQPDLHPSVLQSIAEIAHDEGARALYRRALELLVAADDAQARKDALERLGDFLFQALEDSPAAAEAWRAAARLCDDSPAERERALLLYERAIAAWPGDGQAAEELVEAYARAGDWTKLPKLLRVSIQTDESIGRSVLLLLRLEESAVEARALDEFVSLVDDLIVRVGRESPEQSRALARARARALGTDPARQAEASEAYRSLVEAFGSDEDMRDFEAFSESRSNAEDRHCDRRWLYRWRAAQSARYVEVLAEWAKAEEEYGAPEEAIAVYQRLADTEAGRMAALEALCRLKLQAGDLAGGLSAFKALRSGCDEERRLALDLSITRRLYEDLGQPAEAASVLGPALAAEPPVYEAHELARQMLADPGCGDDIADRFEQVANALDDRSALRILALVAAGETASANPGRRLARLQRIVDLSALDPATALRAVLRGATEMPGSVLLWDGAERIARGLGSAELVAAAYQRALGGDLDPTLAEELGRRMVRIEEECAIEYAGTPDALLRVLQLAPEARWALDRVKVALGSRARWDELFGLFDRAIDASADENRRRDLLREAAFVADDLAHLPERAIAYFESAYALQADDAAVESALERLYERRGRRVELVALLTTQVGRASGVKRRGLRRRIASLRLDLCDAEQAGRIIDEMLEEGAVVADVADLLERLVERPEAVTQGERAARLLLAHYEAIGRFDDALRIAERALALATRIFGEGPTKDRASYHHRLARQLVRAARLDDALAQLRAAIEMHPAHPGIMHDLARVALDLGQLDLSEGTYRGLLLGSQSPTDDATGSPPTRADVFVDLGEISLRKGDPARAADLVDSALDDAIARGDDVGRIERRLRSRRRYDLLARALERRVERGTGADDRAVALRDLHELWTGRLGRPSELGARIRGYAERIAGDLDHEGVTDGSAWTALAAVYSTFGDGGGALDTTRLARLVDAAAPKAQPGPERSGLRVILATIMLDQAKRLDEVIRVLSSAVEGDPGGVDMTGAAAATWEAAAGAYRNLLLASERESSREDLVRIAVATADACARAGGPGEAREALGRVADLLSQSPEWAPDLERLCRAQKDWRPLARLLVTQADQEGNIERKTELLLRAGRLFLEAPGDAASALRAIELARATSPGSVGASLYLEIGRAHLALDEIIEAFGALTLGFGLDASDGEIAMLLGLVAVDLDETDAAQRAFAAVIALPPPTDASDPGASGAAKSIAFHQLASLALANGDLAEARGLASQALGADPGHRAARALIATIDSRAAAAGATGA